MEEAVDKKVVFTFGRFQPPTSGHQLLITKVQQVAKKLGAEHQIYPSPSHDAKTNPLSHSDKVKYMKKMFKGANIINDKKIINPFKVVEQLNKEGYTHVTMVVGSDRVQEFKKAIGKYVGPNGYNFKFNVVSAGKRDPDAEGVVGMSGSKMRQAVKDGDLASFSKGVPTGVSKKDIQGLFKAIKKGMGLKERKILSFIEHEEFKEFEEREVNELTRQARIKMSRAARRTAKKRAKTRERRKKRIKGGEKLKTIAQKGARNVFRNKFLRGKQWSKLSHSEKERIDQRIKKINPRKLKALQSKLLPGIRKAERERIASLRDLQDKPGDVGEETKRDYKKEYQEYHGKPEQRANRSKRVLARRKLEKEGRVAKGDGRDVDHKDGNPQNNSTSNLRVMNRHTNRSRNNNKNK